VGSLIHCEAPHPENVDGAAGTRRGRWDPARSALVSNFVSFDAVVNQDDIRLVFDWDVADLPVQQENIAQVDDLETLSLSGYLT